MDPGAQLALRGWPNFWGKSYVTTVRANSFTDETIDLLPSHHRNLALNSQRPSLSLRIRISFDSAGFALPRFPRHTRRRTPELVLTPAVLLELPRVRLEHPVPDG